MKGKTVVFILAITFLLLGIIICGATYASAGFKFESLSVSPPAYEKKYDVNKSEVDSIYVSDMNKKIIIESSPDDSIHVTYYENAKSPYKINVNNNKLSITYEENRPWYEFIGFQYSDEYSLSIQLPDNMSGIEIHSSNGIINVSNIKLLNDLTLNTSNGNISVDNLSCANIIAKSSNGKLDFTNLNIAGNIDGKTSNSKVTANNVSSQKISLKTLNGAIGLQDVSVANDIDCRTSNGAITGNVKGSMNDFKISSSTSNGSNNLPKSTEAGSKTMEMETSNGGIDIQFK